MLLSDTLAPPIKLIMSITSQATIYVQWVVLGGTALAEESPGTSVPNLRLPQTATLLRLVPNPPGHPQSPPSPRWGRPTAKQPHSRHHSSPWWRPSLSQSNPPDHNSCLYRPPCSCNLLTKPNWTTTSASCSLLRACKACSKSRWSPFRISRIYRPSPTYSPWLQSKTLTHTWLQSWLSSCPATQLSLQVTHLFTHHLILPCFPRHPSP